MIIRCPECTTGFNLPDERITPDGTKLQCSKCEHVFRVRADGAGEPEIYYKPRDNDEESAEAETAKETRGGSGSPFSGGGLGLKPKKSSAFGDLNDDDKEMGAFESAFEEKSNSGPAAEKSTDYGEETVVIQKSEVDDSESQPAPAAQPAPEPEPQSALSGSGNSYGDPQDHVDPSFGKSGPVFNPDTGEAEVVDDGQVVEEHPERPAAPAGPPQGAAAAGPPPTASGPPKNAAGPPPTAQKMAQPEQKEINAAAAAAARKNPAVLTGDWDVDDLAAHKIGGSLGMKAVIFSLLLSIVVMAFLGVVAMRNDGFIDFQAFSEMIQVAFSDGEYEPRPDWVVETGDTIIVEPSEPVSVEGVHGELIAVGQGDPIFVVKGLLRNNEDSRVRDVELRAMVTTMEGRSIGEIAAIAGDDSPISEFRQLRDLDGLDELLGAGDGSIDARGITPFTMVFEDPPQRVIDGEPFSFRVEVANMRGGSGSS